jgi:GNAT superfamily N-acetyltransferase
VPAAGKPAKTPVTVRNAGLDDIETVVQFNALLAAESEGLTLDPETLRAGVQALLSDPAKGRYYIAERDGEVAGQLMVTYEWSDWRNGLFFWIQSVYVEPRHRRSGVFTALYRHVEREASTPGHAGLRLYVHEHNHLARETYTRLGMVPPGYFVLETPDALRSGT